MPRERLINAERLKADLRGLYELAGWGEREVHFSLADMDCNIDMEDSVEAIPIEWLKAHMITHGEVVNGDYFPDEAMELNMYVNDLIERWRMERKEK